jgi:hypothetical protein
MASFTDSPIKFNPYISQQPVEAMVKVGMQKEAAYQEGVQKIQTQIDNIAGLDVVRDVDKAYLQSKLNQLGNNLKTVAAGDFSNFQMVNAVGGMTKQLAGDSGVQNAVASTARYRKELGLLQKDVTDGKDNPANTVKFQKQASKWLNSGNVSDSFSASYVPPRDVWAKIKDIAKEVGVDETTAQQLFSTNTDGTPLVGKDNKPIFNNIMVEKTLKGKDAGKILKAFEMGLSPGDYQQLAINGEYQNSGLDSNALKQRILTDSKQQMDFIENKVQDLKVALANESSKNEKDPKTIGNLQDQLEYFQKSLKQSEQSREANLAKADSNPDAVRGSLYTNDYLHTMSKTLSSQDVSTKNTVSPLFEITMKQNEFNRSIQRDKVADAQFRITRQDKLAENAANREDKALDRQDKALEMFLKYGVKTPGLKLPPGTMVGGERLNEAIPDIEKDAIKNVVEEQFSDSVAELNEMNYKLTLKYFENINKKAPGESDAAYSNRMKKAIDQYARGNKEQAADFQTGDVNTFTARFAGKQLQNWSTNPKSVPQEYRGLIEDQSNLAKELDLQSEKIAAVKKEARVIAKAQGLTTMTDKEIKDNIKEATVYIDPRRQPNSPLAGQTIHLSKQDVADFSALHPEIYNTFGGWTVDSDQEKRQELSKKRLTLKYGTGLNILDRQLFDISSVKGELGGSVNTFGRVNPAVAQAGKFINNSDYQKLAKIESDLYLKKGIVKQPTSVALYRGEDKPEDFDARVSSVVDKYNLDGKMLASEGVSTADIQAAILGKDGKAVKIVSYPGIGNNPTTHVLRVTTANKGAVNMTIDDSDYRMLTRSNPPENEATPRVVEKLSFSDTTNSSGTPEGAWWSSKDFVNFKSKTHSLTGDLVKDVSNPNIVHMRVYLHDKRNPSAPPEIITIPEPINTFNEDGSYSNKLDYLPAGLSVQNLEQFRKQ